MVFERGIVKLVFVAPSGAEAQLVKGLLEAKGIQAEVRNEELFSVLSGLLAVQQSVWVVEDHEFERAAAFVEGYQHDAGPASAEGEGWRCPQCGEQVEAQFTDCWQCGSARTEP
ncbi:MAG: hypothetical protein B7Z68_07245 [Acidobacteria bacterium 21-70-11]|nr:MAG: hypothetical protein B7Z68_07245 [Acidobacteria bacterium 21-70-11]